ncbi:Uncharacterised protein [Mycobacteroides abscessus subsp. abscessus]|nr:Uncharacterised protein [Mycobacteroides abscessus subsp. abscessus]
MIDPPPAAIIGSATDWIPRKVPVRLTSMICFHLSRRNFWTVDPLTMPALFTRTLTLPKSSTAAATAACQSSGDVTSRCT